MQQGGPGHMAGNLLDLGFGMVLAYRLPVNLTN